MYYICQGDDGLVEVIFDGELNPAEEVGSAKEGTPGALLVIGDKRVIYCLSDKFVLQDFIYDDDMGAWEEGKLASLGVVASEMTTISAVRDPQGRIYVFFQGKSGQIQSFTGTEEGAWELSKGLPSTKPIENASIHAVDTNGTIRVFYANQDHSIHELVLNNGKWTDTKVEQTDAGSNKTDITTILGEEGKYRLQFNNEEGEVFVLNDGLLSKIGTMTEEGFKQLHNAQAAGRGAYIYKVVQRTYYYRYRK